MTKPADRHYFSRGKGVFSAAGPQARFIVFLIFLLIGYTFLLKIFQKLAGIVEMPLFLPIALITLLAYIGIAGALYSHKFIGPITRIRRTLERIAEGDYSVTLRLRDSDDPMMQELALSVTALCERSRRSHAALRDAADGLLKELTALAKNTGAEAAGGELKAQAGRVHARQADFEKALELLGK